jgi:hydrogenase maturation protease
LTGRESDVVRLLVVGLGNPLMGDDGVGAMVAGELRRSGPPSGSRVEVLPDILHLTTIWEHEPDVWLVDAVRCGGLAGSIHVFEHEDILGMNDGHSSAHRLSLPEGLRWLLHGSPGLTEVRFRLWGVEPKTIAPGSVVTPPVEAAVIELSRRIVREAVGRNATEARGRAMPPGFE